MTDTAFQPPDPPVEEVAPVEAAEEVAPTEVPVVEAVAAPVASVHRFRNDTDHSIQWHGHTFAPHEDVEILMEPDPGAAAAGLTETTFTSRFPAPPVEAVEHEQDEPVVEAEAPAVEPEAPAVVAEPVEQTALPEPPPV